MSSLVTLITLHISVTEWVMHWLQMKDCCQLQAKVCKQSTGVLLNQACPLVELTIPT